MATPAFATMRWNWLSGASASCPLAAPTAPAVNGLDQVSESALLRNIERGSASDACQLRLGTRPRLELVGHLVDRCHELRGAGEERAADAPGAVTHFVARR
jgi:hypothetical protein